MSEVLVVLELKSIANKEEFESYLKDEGFDAVDDEEFAYVGFSSTPAFNVRAYIFGVFEHAFNIAEVNICKLICQIGSNNFETYLYKKGSFFEELH